MRTMHYVVAAVMIAAVTGIAHAELQNVEVGGSIRIRGNSYHMDSLGKSSWIEQRTRLSVKADFTQDVSAFIEFDYFSDWGEDFRSNYLSGEDFRAANEENVRLYQAYIEAQSLWGTPLTARVGRQELSFGSEWLIGVNDAAAEFRGLSFDALRLTFDHDLFTLDAVAAKLAEQYGSFLKDDTDLYMLYFSYIGIEDIALDAYWMYVRDDGVLLGDRVNLHTVGLRAAGALGGFDFDVEGAYQFGSVYGRPSACPFGFGEADIDYDGFGANVELGYTFEMNMAPRLFGRFAYFNGGGGRPEKWYTNDRKLPFNRLFSNWEYTEFFANTDESNLLYYALGVSAMPTEALEVELIGAMFQAARRAPDRGWWLWRDRAAKTIGYELGVYADYNYSEDLVIRAGYAHFFGRRGLERNEFILNGLGALQGDRRDNYNYVFIETELSF